MNRPCKAPFNGRKQPWKAVTQHPEERTNTHIFLELDDDIGHEDVLCIRSGFNGHLSCSMVLKLK